MPSKAYEDFNDGCHESYELAVRTLMVGEFDPMHRLMACLRLSCILARMCGLSFWKMLRILCMQWNLSKRDVTFKTEPKP